MAVPTALFPPGELVAGYDLADAVDQPDLDAVVRLAAQLCDVPTAVINVLDERVQRPLASVGFLPAVCARPDSMCAVTVVAPEPIRVVDARRDPRFATNPFVTGELARIRFYASSQLRAPHGPVLGTLCVFDEVPRELADEQARGLDDLARQVIDLLELRRRTYVLHETVDELDGARAELLRSNEQLAAFAGQVGHDLASPLLGVRHLVEVLAARPAVATDETATLVADHALAALGRMTSLLEDLLSYARVGGALRRQPVALGPLLDEVRADLHEALAGVPVTAEGLPTVTADRTQLSVVLQNLLANAARFRRTDRPLALRVTAAPSATGTRVTVHDNGRGVPPELRDEAFGLLKQVHDAAVVPGGSGLGLATCRRVVAAHGGAIGIEDGDGDESGHGAAVWFTLPS